MVQEQRLQLKMKILLGYKIKIVVLWKGGGGGKVSGENLVVGFFRGGGSLFKTCADDGILVK